MPTRPNSSDWDRSFKGKPEPEGHPAIEWIKQNLRQFIILSVIWFVVLPLIFFSGAGEAPSLGPTRIAIKGAPRRVYEPGVTNKVQSLAVVIKNIGENPATLMDVSVEVAGRSFPLQGPQDVAPGQTVEYTATVNLFLHDKSQITPHASCYNCR